MIQEGEQVKEGQLLAIFDNQPKILADLQIARARLDIINEKIIAQKRELNRYKQTVLQGASPKVLLDEKNDLLIELFGLSKETYAEISSLEVDLFDSKLRSPIDGVILKVYTREGERPGGDGVLQVGQHSLD